MRFLITNDDGILAHGIECLIEAAEPLGEVYVVAPDREQSATSHSLTLHHPLRPVQRAERRWQVDGTPTDCVMLAVEALMPERPDFVLSGINHGQNMGEDVLYSGHRRRGDGRARAGHPVDRVLVRRRRPARRPRASARAGARCSRRCSQRLIVAADVSRATRCSTSTCRRVAGGRGEGRAAHAARAPRVLRTRSTPMTGSVGARRSSGSAAARSRGRARRTPTSARSRRATSR